jgi:exonuclease VII large subunit
MRTLLALLVLVPALAFGDAASEAELRQLQAALTEIQQEQQSLYQHFQMIQELRRADLQQLNPEVVQNSPVYSMDNPSSNFDDQARIRRERDARIQQYTQDLNRLYARYRELDDQKYTLRARVNELTQPGTQ